MKKEIILSKNNPTVVRLAKLKSKKHREDQGLFMLDGEKLFCEAAEYGAEIEFVLLSEDFLSERAEFAEYVTSSLEKIKSDNTRVLVLEKNVFEKITSEKSPQGIITVVKTIDFFEKYNTIYNNESFYQKPRAVIMLCDVRDPGNLGTVLRSACAFDIDAVVIDRGCCDLFSPKVVRGSMGALFKAPIKLVDNALREIEDMRAFGVHVYAAALDREAVGLDKLEIDNNESVCFVIGNEGSGLEKSVIDACERSVFIPMAENTESLNASIASSVLMWELFKRKRK